MRLGDVAVIVVAGLCAYWLRHGVEPPPQIYLWSIVIAGALTANFMHLAGLYDVRNLRQFTVQFGKVLAAWAGVATTLLALAYFTQQSLTFSRVWVASWFALGLACLFIIRATVIVWIERLTREGKLAVNVVIVGAGQHGRRLIQRLHGDAQSSVSIIGIFDDRKTRIPEEIEGHKVQGSVDDLLVLLRAECVDEIIIALPWAAGSRILEILKKLRTVSVDVQLCPDLIAHEIPHLGYDDVAGMPMLKVVERPIAGWQYVIKAIEDGALAAIFLALCSPLFAVIAILIKLDSRGPVFFRQKRYGFNNNEFTVLKFRTMFAAAAGGDGETVKQAQRDDPRITRVGRWLRRTSLDELPQLINVLKGDMSLVGPRPHAVAHNVVFARLVDDYLGRHRVKPGITGWAQVNGLRGETPTPELMRRRVQHDLHYIDHWSVMFDLKILFMTMFVGFTHKNAY